MDELRDLKKDLTDDQIKLATDTLNSDVNIKYVTGCIPLDIILGGGIFGGKMYEISGRPGVGKSALYLTFLKATQDYYTSIKKPNISLLIESESALDKLRAHEIGCDLSKMLITEAIAVEDGFDAIHKFCDKLLEKNISGIIGWDTIAAAPARTDLDTGGQFKQGITIKPRIMARELCKVIPNIAKIDTPLVMVNQVHANIGSPMGGWETPGGEKLKFFASTRLQLKKVGKIEQPLPNGEKQQVGIISQIKAIKNRMFQENLPINLVIMGESGLDSIATAELFLKDRKLCKTGAWKSFDVNGEMIKWQNTNSFKELYTTNEKFKNAIDYKIYSYFIGLGTIAKCKLIKNVWELENLIFGKKMTEVTDKKEMEKIKLLYPKLKI